MRVRGVRLVVPLAIACVVLIASFTKVRGQDDRKNFALQFNGSGSIATGAPINRTDNLRMEALVRYNGPGPSDEGGFPGPFLLFNDAHGCCDGWGLTMMGNAGYQAGWMGIVTGGAGIINFDGLPQSLTLPVGVWQRVRVESRGQLVTLSFPGKDGSGPVFSFGMHARGKQNVGDEPPSVIIGKGFNGLIKDVRFTSLDNPNRVLEFWPFNEGTGSIATSVEGAVLNLTNTTWVRVPTDDHDNDDN